MLEITSLVLKDLCQKSAAFSGIDSHLHIVVGQILFWCSLKEESCFNQSLYKSKSEYNFLAHSGQMLWLN